MAAVENDSVLDQLCARIDELEREKEALAAQLDRAEEERAALLEQVLYWRECATESNAERNELASELRSHKAAIDGLQGERDELTGRVAELKRYNLGLANESHRLQGERDDLNERYHLLASEMVYEGNSVQHWRQKALAYKDCAGAIYRLKQLTGADSPDSVVDAVQALAAHVETARPMVMAYRSRIGGALWSLEGEELEWAKQADAWLSYTPTSSLARLKAQWQAEWIKSAELQARRVRNFSDPDDVFEAVPLTIICQAEGGGDL